MLRRFLRRSEEVSRKHGLTPRQYLLLLMIKASEESPDPATIGRLVERLALTQSTVTELVQRAEEAGLVHAASVAGRRARGAPVAHARGSDALARQRSRSSGPSGRTSRRRFAPAEHPCAS